MTSVSNTEMDVFLLVLGAGGCGEAEGGEKEDKNYHHNRCHRKVQHAQKIG